MVYLVFLAFKIVSNIPNQASSYKRFPSYSVQVAYLFIIVYIAIIAAITAETVLPTKKARNV